MEAVDAPSIVFNKAVGSVCSIRFEQFDAKTGLLLSPPQFGTIVKNQQLVRKQQFYRVKTGLTFAHSGVIYRESDYNITTALPRLLAYDREYYDWQYGMPVKIDLTEKEVRQRQIDFAGTRVWRRMLLKLSSSFKDFYESRFIDWFDAQFMYPTLPHVKKDLRMRAKIGIDERLRWLELNPHHVKTKMKTAEWAKFAKKARNICDIGVEGSLVAGVCCEFLKLFLKQFEYSPDYTCQFHGKPDKDDLSLMFKDLWSCPKNLSLHYFSDDSCLSFRCTDGVYRCNMDVASADSSHYEPIFDAILATINGCGYFERCMIDCVKQLTLPLKFMDCNGKLIGVSQPRLPVLYSGSTLTTLVNNYSQLFMFAKLTRVGKHTVNDIKKAIPIYMSQIGYSVTVQHVEFIEDFQFLKYSCDSEYVPFINLGPFVRMLGWSKRDVPKTVKGGKRQTLKSRSEDFEAGKILGYKSLGVSRLYDVLAEKYQHVTSPAIVDADRYFKIETYSRVSDESIMRRYKITPLEWHSLLSIVADINVSDCRFYHIRHGAIDKIMEVDYGYGRPLTHDL